MRCAEFRAPTGRSRLLCIGIASKLRRRLVSNIFAAAAARPQLDVASHLAGSLLDDQQYNPALDGPEQDRRERHGRCRKHPRLRPDMLLAELDG